LTLLSADLLQNEMFSPSGEYSESRPFKIFISLLDKWEIGGPLADVLIYDAFKSIKHLMEENREGNDDVGSWLSLPYLSLKDAIASNDGKHALRGVGA
jgi:hypothetical protein